MSRWKHDVNGPGDAKHQYRLEELEPRILLSADIAAVESDEISGLLDTIEAPVGLSGGNWEDALRSASRKRSGRHEIAFIDTSIEGYRDLADDLLAADGVALEVLLVDSTAEGILQITEALRQRGDVDALHIFSHGTERGLRLGSSWLTAESLRSFENELLAWRSALGEGADLLLYGCDLASSDEGRKLTASLRSLTGADVAASDDLTGSARLGGDWSLELVLGAVEARPPVAAAMSWSGVLGPYNEVAQSWSATTTGSWETKDLSSLGVPASAVVEIAVGNAATSLNTAGVRAFGSSLERKYLLEPLFLAGEGDETFVAHVQTDASSRIETFSTDASQVNFTLLGYWESGTYVEAFDTFTLSGSGAWEDVNLSAYGVGSGEVAEIAMSNNSTGFGFEEGGLRTEGTSLERRIVVDSGGFLGPDGNHVETLLVQADGTPNAMIEAYTSDRAKVDFTLLGYWSSAPGSYVQAFSDLGSPASSATWETKDLSSFGALANEVADIVLVQEASGNDGWIMGAREAGSSDTRSIELRASISGTTARWHVAVDASSNIEWFHEDLGETHSFLLTGYWDVEHSPVLALPAASVNFTEGDGATVIDASATVTDVDSADFAGGTLTVDFTANGSSNDRLAVNDQGAGSGNIAISGTDVTYDFGAGAVTIGSFTGGTDGSTPLVVSLNSSATPAAVQALVRNVTFANNASDPSTATRTVRFVVTDGDGGTSTAVTETVALAGDNVLEVTTTSDTKDGTTTSIDALLADRGGDGEISLREAIEATNNTANGGSPDEIHFEIPDALVDGAHTIAVGSGGLPTITEAVVIDGTTDADYGSGPVVVINGNGAGAANGLTITGGGSTVRGLVIHRFTGIGITISGGGSNTIAANYIGTDVTGATDLGNTSYGILINGSASNVIGGNGGSDGNVVSGNGGRGIYVLGVGATGTRIEGNLVGLNASGTGTLVNDDDAIGISNAPTTSVGGTTSNHRNVIAAASGQTAVDVSGSATTGTVVEGNYVGTASDGTSQLTSGAFGLRIFEASTTRVGGTTSAAANVVAGYTVTGITISSASATGTLIQGNSIGTDAAGTLDLTDGIYGITLQNSATNIEIGGTASGAGNRIANNSSDGIRLFATNGDDNPILGNLIYANGGLGINLVDAGDPSDGVTSNDSGDSDAGPNALQNYPVLGSVVTYGIDNVTIQGTLDTDQVNQDYRIEFFASSSADGSGYGEAETYIGSLDVTTDGSGDVTFTTTISTALVVGRSVTATATVDLGGGVYGDTSEFASNVVALPFSTALWFSTDANVGAPGADGLSSGWTEGQVLSFGGPDLTHGAATDGDLARVIDFDTFTSDAVDVGAMHFVSRNMTVGGVNGTFDLKAGDILVSFLQDETVLAAYSWSGSNETVGDEDLLVFRPTAFGDYSSGTFFLLLEDVVSDDLKGVSLIEVDTTIGGTDVLAGSFLVIDTTSATSTVDLFVPTGVGSGTTTGSTTPFIDVNDLGIVSDLLRGIEVIESAVTLGGQALAAGSILATLRDDDNVSGVGSNGLLVDQTDVFVLTLTATGDDTTVGTAAMFLDGTDVGLDDSPSQESPYALALFHHAQLVVDTTSDVSDGDTSSIAALITDPGSDGKISLREAIEATEATTNGDGPDQIHFEITDALVSGAHTIVPGSALPQISDALVIDGTTESDYGGSPIIELNGESASSAIGLDFAGASGTLRGLVINRFDSHGLRLGGSGGHIVRGNYVGTDVAGAADQGNLQQGIQISSSNNTIGGTSSGDGNLVSGNDWTGISIQLGTSSGNVIQGNLIGTNAAGTAAIGNGIDGVDIFNGGPDNNTIGGTTAAARNIIAGNLRRGITISGSGTTGNTITGNSIGTDAAGTTSIPNVQGGVWIRQGASDNVVGGSAAGSGNIIAYNGAVGVEIEDAASIDNSILGNRIYSNTDLGIDLVGGTEDPDGVTSNDGDDGDSGANDLQNHVVLTRAFTDNAGTVTVDGSIDSTASTDFRIEFFASAAADGSGYGEAERSLGFTTVTTDGGGDATFSVAVSASVVKGEFVTATATVDSGGGDFDSTSEFAENVTAVDGNPEVLLPGGAVSFTEGDGATVIDGAATVSDIDSADFDSGTLTVDFTANGTANDRLAIEDQGAGSGNISLSGSNVTHDFGAGAVTIGSFAGGTDGSTPLVVTLNSSAAAAAVQALARAITFDNVSEDPSTAARTVRFVLTDGDGGTSTAVTETINVAGDNDDPVVGLPGGAVSFTEGDGATVIDGSATVSDVDSADLDTGTLTVDFTANGTANDRLAINDQGAGSGNISLSGSNVTYDFGAGAVTIGSYAGGTDGSTPLVVTLNSSATAAAVQALARAITFDNVSEDPSTSARTVRFVVTDGDTGTSTAVSETVNVAGDNDDPVVGLPGSAVSFTEGDGATAIDSGATVTDVDSADFDTGTLTIDFTANGTANDRLSIEDQGAGSGNISLSGSNVTHDFGAGAVTIGSYAGGTDGSTPLVVTLNSSATAAAVQALARAITFDNVSEDPSTAARTVRFVLTDGDGGTSTAVTETINVAGDNDAPVVALPGGAVSFTEGDGATVIDSAATVTDVDSTDFNTGTLTIDFTANGSANDRLAIEDQGAGSGNISLSGSNVTHDFGAGAVTIGSFAGGTDGSTPLVVTLNSSATAAAVQALARAITFDNVSEDPSTAARTVRFVVTDGDTGTSTAVTETVNVAGDNDDPVVGLPGGAVSFTEGDGATVIDSAATVTDVDSADFDTGTLTIDFTANGTSNDRLAIEDQGAGSGKISLSGSNVTYDFGAGAVTIGSYAGGTDGSTPLVVTLNSSATAAAVQALARAITYNNVSEDPSTAARTVRFVVTDGDTGTSTAVSETVNVAGDNDDPVIGLPGGAVSFTEGDGATAIDSGATVTDVDSADFDTGTLTIDFTANGTSNDRLAIEDQGAGSGNISLSGSNVTYDFGAGAVTIGSYAGGTDGSTPLVVTLNSSATAAAVQALARAITFDNVSEDPSTSARTVRFVVTDGDTGTSTAVTETVNVAGDNDDPVIGLPGGAVSFTEGDGATAIDSGATVTDVDSADFDTGTLTIDFTANGTSNDRLAIEDQGAGSGNISLSGSNVTYDFGAGAVTIGSYAGGTDGSTPLVVTLNSSATAAAVQALARAITFDNVSEDPSTAARTVRFVLTDGDGGTSTAVTETIGLTAENDRPSLTLPAAQAINSETDLAISGISVSDVDGAFVRVSLSVSSGVLTLASTVGLAFATGDGADDSSIVFTASTSDANAALATVTYRSAAGFGGSESLDVIVDDQGNSGAGGTLSDSGSVAIAVNARPVAADDPLDFVTLVNGLGPLGYWRLGEVSGTAAIDLAGASDGTYVGPTIGLTGALADDGAAGFDGVDDHVAIPHDPSFAIDAGSIQLWFNANNSARGHLFSKDAQGFGDGGHASIWLTASGRVQARLQSASTSFFVQSTSDEPIVSGQWHHVVFTFGAGGMGLWVDGQLADTETYTGGLDATSGGAGNSEPIALGGSTQSSASGSVTPLEDFFDGRLDEVALFGSQLTASEIRGLHAAGRQYFTVDEDSSLDVTESGGVLVNDSDADGDSLDALLVTGPSNAASFTLDADGSFVYTPVAGFSGLDSFTYRVHDGKVSSAAATATITVLAVNDRPTLTLPGGQSVDEETDLDITGIGIADVDAGSGDVRVDLSVSNGVLTLAQTAGLTFSTGDGSADASMIFTASLSDANAALATVTYRGGVDFSGSESLTVVVDDQGNSGTGGVLSASGSVTILVDAVNDPPSLTLPGAKTVDEDVDLEISGVSVADVDAGTGTIRVDLAVSKGALSLAEATGLAFSTGDGLDDATMAFTGSLADVNAALSTLTYRGGLDFNGGDRLDVLVEDRGNSGSGGSLSASGSMTITVSAVNDAPEITLPASQATLEGMALVLSSAGGNPVLIGDVDVGGNDLEVVLQATNGALTLGAVAGLDFTSGDGTADASMTFTGSLADINAALDGLTLDPAPGFAGTVTLSMSVDDLGGTGGGGSQSDFASTDISIGGVNDAPTLSLPGPQVVDEDVSLAIPGIAVADIDIGTGQIEIDLSVTAGALTLTDRTGLTFSEGDGSGDAAMRFRGSLVDVNDALATLVYRGSSEFSGSDTLVVVVDDGGNTGSGGARIESGSVAITVTAVNDRPTVTAPAPVTVVEDGSVDIAGLVIGDADLGSGSIGVDLSAAGGVVSLAGTTGLAFTTGDGSDDAAMVFTGSLVDVNAALSTVQFRADQDFVGAAALDLVVDDQGSTGSGGPLTASASVGVSVTAVNDAPTISVPGTRTIPESTALVFSTASGNEISVSDVDAASGGLEMTLTASDGELTLAGVAGLGFSVGDGVADAAMTFVGTLDAINAALDGLVFDPPTDFRRTATIAASIDDQGNTGSGGPLADTGSTDVVVGDVNQPPVISSPGPQTVPEDTLLRFSVSNGNALSISDPDSGAAAVLVTLTAARGTLSIEQTTDLTLRTGAAGVRVSFEGAIPDANAALESLSFSPEAGYVGAASLSISVNDQGGGPGGSLTTTETVAIAVTAINDAPEAADAIFHVDESSANGTFVGVVAASDPESDTLRYAIVGGNIGNAFAIDAATGEISVQNDEALVASNPTFSLAIQVGDGGSPELFDTASVVVQLIADPGVTVDEPTPQPSPESGPESDFGPLDTADDAKTTPVEPPSADDGSGLEADDTDDEADLDGDDTGAEATEEISVEEGDGDGFGGSAIEARSLDGTRAEDIVIEQPPSDLFDPVESAGLRDGVPGALSVVVPVRRSVSARVAALSSGAGDTPGVEVTRIELPELGFTEDVFVDELVYEALDTLSDEMDEAVDEIERRESLIIGTVEITGFALTVGVVSFILRAGSIAASFLSTMPLWMRFDPLPVLALTGDARRKWKEDLEDGEQKDRREVGDLLDSEETPEPEK